MHRFRSDLPPEEELDRAFTQWEREQKVQVKPFDGEWPEDTPPMEHRFNPGAVEAAWRECE